MYGAARRKSSTPQGILIFGSFLVLTAVDDDLFDTDLLETVGFDRWVRDDLAVESVYEFLEGGV